jgi:hypothetical protein
MVPSNEGEKRFRVDSRTLVLVLTVRVTRFELDQKIVQARKRRELLQFSAVFTRFLFKGVCNTLNQCFSNCVPRHTSVPPEIFRSAAKFLRILQFARVFKN